MYNVSSLSDILGTLFLAEDLQLSVRAICVFIFCVYSQQSPSVLSSAETFKLRTDFLDSLIEAKEGVDRKGSFNKFMTPKKHSLREAFNSDFKKASRFDGMSPFSDVKHGFQEKSLLLEMSGSFSNSSINESGVLDSSLTNLENQSMFSLESKLKNFGFEEPDTQFSEYSSKNTLIRFNNSNLNEMPLRFRKRYFADHQQTCKKQEPQSGSLPEELFSLSGIIKQDFAKDSSNIRLKGMNWSIILSHHRPCIKKSLNLPENLNIQMNSNTLEWMLNILRSGSRQDDLPGVSFTETVDNEKLGYVLMLLAMDNRQGSPAIFSMLLVQAFKNSSIQVRQTIFDTLTKALEAKEEGQMDSTHRKLFSDVLFAIFLEDREWLMKQEIPKLLFDNGINHLAFIIMNEMLSSNFDKKLEHKKKKKRVRTAVKEQLEINVNKGTLKTAGVRAERYFRLCELLGLSQEKWGLYECLFDEEKNAVKLLKLKENKYYRPFVEHIQQNPNAFKESSQKNG
jgi:hypothetical protein